MRGAELTAQQLRRAPGRAGNACRGIGARDRAIQCGILARLGAPLEVRACEEVGPGVGPCRLSLRVDAGAQILRRAPGNRASRDRRATRMRTAPPGSRPGYRKVMRVRSGGLALAAADRPKAGERDPAQHHRQSCRLRHGRRRRGPSDAGEHVKQSTGHDAGLSACAARSSSDGSALRAAANAR